MQPSVLGYTWHQTGKWPLGKLYRTMPNVYCTGVSSAQFREVIGLPVAKLTNICLSKLVEDPFGITLVAVVQLLNILQKAFFPFWNLESMSKAAYL